MSYISIMNSSNLNHKCLRYIGLFFDLVLSSRRAWHVSADLHLITIKADVISVIIYVSSDAALCNIKRNIKP